ncbi:MAG: hypothetical protein ACI9OJ_005875 [Myxococcota bacterium]|jgi:hypothetical protein
MMDPETSAKPKTPGERLFSALFVGLVFGMFFIDMLRDFRPVKVSMLLFPLCWCVLVAVHELGHALAAWAMNWRVERIVIGFGRTLKHWQFGETRVELRAIPISGFMVPVPRRPDRARLASALIYASGPGIELALVLLIALAVGTTTLTTVGDSYAMITVQTFCAAALTGAIINLIPFDFSRDSASGGGPTDGMGILMSLTLTEQHFATMAMLPELRKFEDAVRAGNGPTVVDELDEMTENHPEILDLHILLGKALAQKGERMEALLRLQAARRLPHLHESERVFIDTLMASIRSGNSAA